MFNDCVNAILDIARTTKTLSIRAAVKRLKLTYTGVRRLRFYDGVNILRALKVVPALKNYKGRNPECSMIKDAQAIYHRVHCYPGPHAPVVFCDMLNVERRRVCDVFAVLQAMGLVYWDKKHYGLTSDLDENASYWWGLLCSAWGDVDRNALLKVQVINLKLMRIARRQPRGEQQWLTYNTTRILDSSWMSTPKLWFHDISELQNSDWCLTTVPNDILQDCSPADHYAGEDGLAAIIHGNDIPIYDQLRCPKSDIPLYNHTYVSDTVQILEDIVQGL